MKLQYYNSAGLSFTGKRLRKHLKANDFRFATWNVLSLYRPGALKLLLEQLLLYRIDVVAIQEVRWIGTGVLEKKDCNIYYSCHQRLHMYGTGFVVRKRLKDQVIDFKPFGPRICYIRIKGKFFNYSVFSIYAPTNVAQEQEKDNFYEEVEQAMNTVPQHDIKILLGDFNAQVGKEEVYRSVIGKQSFHDVSNDNGLRMISLAVAQGMVVGSTLFPSKTIRKITHVGPDKTESQIDHVLISARHRSNLTDVKSFWGANVDSDHNLVIATIRARISNSRKIKGVRGVRWNIAKLLDPQEVQEFQGKISERILNSESSQGKGINEIWTVCKENIVRAADEVLGVMESSIRPSWFDEKCRMATNEKNEAYKLMLAKKGTRAITEIYRNKRRDEKRIHQKKKRVWEKERIQEIETFRGQNEIRKFFRRVNEDRRGFKPRITQVKRKDGSLVTDKASILERWVEHFDKLLNDNDQAGIRPAQLLNIGGHIKPPDRWIHV